MSECYALSGIRPNIALQNLSFHCNQNVGVKSLNALFFVLKQHSTIYTGKHSSCVLCCYVCIPKQCLFFHSIAHPSSELFKVSVTMFELEESLMFMH